MVPQSQAAVGAGFFGTDKAKRYFYSHFHLCFLDSRCPPPPAPRSTLILETLARLFLTLASVLGQAYVMPTDASAGEGEGDEDMLEEQRKRKRKADKEKDGKKKKYTDFKF